MLGNSSGGIIVELISEIQAGEAIDKLLRSSLSSQIDD